LSFATKEKNKKLKITKHVGKHKYKNAPSIIEGVLFYFGRVWLVGKFMYISLKIFIIIAVSVFFD